jgi:hypothetical protein
MCDGGRSAGRGGSTTIVNDDSPFTLERLQESLRAFQTYPVTSVKFPGNGDNIQDFVERLSLCIPDFDVVGYHLFDLLSRGPPGCGRRGVDGTPLPAKFVLAVDGGVFDRLTVVSPAFRLLCAFLGPDWVPVSSTGEGGPIGACCVRLFRFEEVGPDSGCRQCEFIVVLTEPGRLGDYGPYQQLGCPRPSGCDELVPCLHVRSPLAALPLTKVRLVASLAEWLLASSK